MEIYDEVIRSAHIHISIDSSLPSSVSYLGVPHSFCYEKPNRATATASVALCFTLLFNLIEGEEKGACGT